MRRLDQTNMTTSGRHGRLLRAQHWIIMLVCGLWTLGQAACAIPGDHDDDEQPSGPPTWRALITAESWQPAATDPLIEHRPREVECSPIGWHPESGGLEIETGYCNYLSLTQSALEDIQAGDLLRIRAWWQTLAHETTATGHLAVLTGGAESIVLWEEYIAIPGKADARDIELEAPVDVPRGTPIILHLHNHGYNTWLFHEFAVLKFD